MTLSALASLYATDKLGHYSQLYELLLRDRRDRVRKVLEIGVLAGASLKMWRDYFPNARIFGIDANLIEIQGIQTFQMDQGDSELLKQVGEQLAPLDLIVDDGSHKVQHQALAVNTLMPFLADDGLFIVEDVNPPRQELFELIPYEFSYFEHHHAHSMAGRGIVISGNAQCRSGYHISLWSALQ